ncbi:MAG: oxygenase MpaB family protein [Nocardiopsaceae bacterium]|nr:oxygenase MpaB family protein [Nocardiopsaceae bacterium]
MTRGTDSGLFPDGAPIRRMAREAVVLGAAGYAILLQVSHPGVGQGVYDHSDFAGRPIDRLHGTLTFVYGMVFGTREEADRIARIVRAMHKKVTGPGYDALDPDLQVWVAATLYQGSVRMYEMAVGPLPPEEKDELYGQAAIFATALGCPADRWPADRAAFDAYWADMVDSIEATDTARSIADALFNPPNPAIRTAARLQRFLAAGLLPPRLREQLDLEWGATQQRGFDRLITIVRAVYPRLPLAVRSLPKNAYMWNIRRRAARGLLHNRPKGLRKRTLTAQQR